MHPLIPAPPNHDHFHVIVGAKPFAPHHPRGKYLKYPWTISNPAQENPRKIIWRIPGIASGESQKDLRRTPEESQEMTNAYLLPDFEDDEEQANYIRFRAKKLFEHELEAWCTDPGKWPSVRNHKTFFAWFRVEVSHMVFDLAGDPDHSTSIEFDKETRS